MDVQSLRTRISAENYRQSGGEPGQADIHVVIDKPVLFGSDRKCVLSWAEFSGPERRRLFRLVGNGPGLPRRVRPVHLQRNDDIRIAHQPRRFEREFEMATGRKGFGKRMIDRNPSPCLAGTDLRMHGVRITA